MEEGMVRVINNMRTGWRFVWLGLGYTWGQGRLGVRLRLRLAIRVTVRGGVRARLGLGFRLGLLFELV